MLKSSFYAKKKSSSRQDDIVKTEQAKIYTYTHACCMFQLEINKKHGFLLINKKLIRNMVLPCSIAVTLVSPSGTYEFYQ